MERDETAKLRRTRHFLLVGCTGLALLLGGLAWDARMHAADPTLAAHEGPLSLTNPSHLIAGFGVGLTALGMAGALAQLLPTVVVVGVGVALVGAAGAATSFPTTNADHAHASSGGGAHDEAVVAGDASSDHAHESEEPIACAWAATHDNDPGHGKTIHGDTDEATTEDCADAEAFLAEIRQAVADLGYEDINVALAAGYEAPPETDSPVPHYLNRALMLDGHVADPYAPESLVYSGWTETPQLIGVLFETNPSEEPAQPAGSLTTWHDHAQQRCEEIGDPTARVCDPGAPRRTMMHVWLFEGAVDPFAHSFRDARGLS